MLGIKVGGERCCVASCLRRRKTNLLSQVKLFGFPKDYMQRKLWEAAIPCDNWTAYKLPKICNVHFYTGAPSIEETDPDYIPSIFPVIKKENNKMDLKKKHYEKAIKFRKRIENQALLNARSKGKKEPNYEPSIFPIKKVNNKTNQKGKTFGRAVKKSGRAQQHILECHSRIPKNCCCIAGCSKKSKTNLLSQVRLFGFPKDPARRRLWEVAARRENWTASKNPKICNAHFMKGAPSLDKNHPDYAPSIFPFNKRDHVKARLKMERFERAMNKQKREEKELIETLRKKWLETHKPISSDSSDVESQPESPTSQSSWEVQTVPRITTFKPSLVVETQPVITTLKPSLEVHNQPRITAFKSCLKAKSQSTNTALSIEDINEMQDRILALETRNRFLEDALRQFIERC